MAFPIYFIAGAVVGAVATYIYKDDKTREKLTSTRNKFKNGANAFMASFQEKPEQQQAAQIGLDIENKTESVNSGIPNNAGG